MIHVVREGGRATAMRNRVGLPSSHDDSGKVDWMRLFVWLGCLMFCVLFWFGAALLFFWTAC